MKAVVTFYPICTQVTVTRTDKMLSLPVHLNIITLSGEKVLKAVIFLPLKIRHVYIVILYIPADKRLRQRGSVLLFLRA